MTLIAETTKDINQLYDENENFFITQRVIGIFEILLQIGWTTKKLIDKSMDMGIKKTELGVALAVSLNRTNPKHLSKIDQELREKTIEIGYQMIVDYEKLEKDNESSSTE